MAIKIFLKIYLKGGIRSKSCVSDFFEYARLFDFESS